VLLFTMAVCLLTGMLFGLVPALRSLRVEVNPTLKNSAAPESRPRFAWGKGLVAGQVALSLVVLFGANLLVRSLQNLMTQQFGFNANSIVVAHVNAIAAGYSGIKSGELAQQLTARLSAVPGVRAISYSRHGLLSGSETSNPIVVPGFTPANPDDRSVREDSVGPNYFDVVGTPILLGRGIGPQDTAITTRVAVVNEAMVKYFFHGENPIGRQFEIDSPEEMDKPFTIIGVSKNAKDHPGRNGALLREAVPPRFFFAYQQDPRPPRLIFEISTIGDPNALLSAVRSQIKAAAPNLSINSIYTVRQELEQSLGSQIGLAKLSGLFAALGLLLACIGLYGIMSYTVAGRTREIGVRIALGAQRRDVLQLALTEGMLLAAVGLAVGIPMSLASGRLLNSFLFGLKSTDPTSLIGMVLLLAVIAAVAGLVPARRATKVDPLVALRYE
ncbi:MAG TPA: FtsX-like permease family protein, partial [Terriglobales bacterium]|nr:FtsX-like permease family protein [Terriglobales bacterium]